jgi:bacterial/archaeal transporter family-2 protein
MTALRPWILVALGFIAGACLPTQAAINAQLRVALGSPGAAAAVSFGIGTVLLALYTAASAGPMPAWGSVQATPWWVWIGGALGALYVISALVIAQRLGTMVLVGTLIAGQMIASVVLDHLGAFGLSVHPVSWQRIAGAVLVVAGALVIRAF